MSADASLSIDLALPARELARASDSARADAARVIALFDQHAAAVFRCLRGCGLDRAAAEDALQETFVALHRHLRLGRPETNLQGWLFQVAQNLARRERRRRGRGVQTTPWEAAPAARLADPAPSPEARVLRREDTRRLRRAFAGLPARDRDCLRLSAEGRRYREIAALLGISLGSVAKSIARSIASLNRTMDSR